VIRLAFALSVLVLPAVGTLIVCVALRRLAREKSFTEHVDEALDIFPDEYDVETATVTRPTLRMIRSQP